MSFFKKIMYYLLPAVSCALLVVSCADVAPEYLVTTISFQGIVSDAEDGTPLERISIVVTEYESSDVDKRNPLMSATLSTSFDGSYVFVTLDNESRVIGDSFFEFYVSDPTGSYLPVLRDLYMSSSSLYYSSSSKSYRVSDNDFALSR